MLLLWHSTCSKASFSWKSTNLKCISMLGMFLWCGRRAENENLGTDLRISRRLQHFPLPTPKLKMVERGSR